jgi:hypothetical protein
MQARIATKPVIIVLLDSWGKLSRLADANRIKNWIESDMGFTDNLPPARSAMVRSGGRVSKVIRVRGTEPRRLRSTRRM